MERPRETWVRIAKKEFENTTGLDFEQLTEHAQARRQWRLHVDAVRALTVEALRLNATF